jgi:hypothetical protein
MAALLGGVSCLNAGTPDSEKRFGEPYSLTGNRLVFTNWYYVRPGGFAWLFEKKENETFEEHDKPGLAKQNHYDAPTGIRIVAQKAVRKGPILKLEKPWESKGVSLQVILKDGEIYRAWGNCDAAPKFQPPSFVAGYFESKDGIHWTRPNLGLVDFAGNKNNNLIPNYPGFVFIDSTAPSEERYKAVGMGEISREEYEQFRKDRPDDWISTAIRDDAGYIACLRAYVSSDGIRWKMLPDILCVDHSDTQTTSYYDHVLKKYVVYTRTYPLGQTASDYVEEATTPRPFWGGDAAGPARRCIGRMESADLRRFSLPEVILEPTMQMLPNDALYTNCRTSIPGAPDHHLMFPTLWHCSNDATSILMASSHDGRVWNYLPGGPVLETGKPGAWDGGCVFGHPNLVELPGGDFVLPYVGYNVGHKYPRKQWAFLPGYATWPKGRIVALEAAGKGEFATVGIMPPGSKLMLNATTSKDGSILVEVADIDRNTVPGRSFGDCKPLSGDHYNTQIVWKGGSDLGVAPNKPVILRFKMNMASLFWLQFKK